MIPLHASTLRLNELFVIPSKDYIAMFKKLLQDSFDKESMVFTTDGRNAIRLALETIGLQKEDEILIPGYACHAVRVAVEPICKPVYVDIDRHTFNINPEEIEKHITKNTRAILVAHLYGNPCNMESIVDMARANNLIIIEDTAQALGGSYKGKVLGSFGDFTVCSFRFTKDISAFRGGALLTNKKLDLYRKPKSSLRVFPWLLITLLAMRQIKLFPAYIYSPLRRHILFPVFSRNAAKFHVSDETLSNYQCYLLYQQFAKMSRIIEKRRENAAYYSDKLKDIVTRPVETDGGKHTYYRYTIQVDKREQLLRFLLGHGIEADKMYDYSLADLTNSLKAGKENLNIPVHQDLTNKELDKIVEAIYEFKRVG